MNVLKSLLRSRKVWLAIVGVVQTIVFATIPDFDPTVWQAINVLLLSVIAGIAVEDGCAKLGKNNVKILPAALEGPTHSMQPRPSVRAWMPPPPAE